MTGPRPSSDWREALATGAAAIAQDGAPALLRVAIQKPMLPFAADFRWLILPFHVVLSLKTRGKALNGSGEDGNEQGGVNLISCCWSRLRTAKLCICAEVRLYRILAACPRLTSF